ncbi:MAG: filamentous hemagglutinin N-terminal domain-containing protein, partial [Rhodobacteraceae bacterium]|nr:filamentous hemagglutinin N-terminal domain-containing protein [Paracoccaceae bacterium]
MLVPVPEGMRGVGAPRRSLRRRLRRLAAKAGGGLAGGLALYPFAVAALPTGGQVTSGQANISQSGPGLTVTQSSANAILNWQSFDLGAQETVTFRQPDTNSIALNRVQGSNASAIYGHLNANGQVFLINPNGVYFAPGAHVNVGGLVASTRNIADQDFQSGTYHFSGSNANGVVNDGTVTASSGGYVAFIGNHVDNEGTIDASGGSVALGAGGAVDMALAGNRLLQFQVNQSALDAAVKNGGAIRADDGTVILSAQSKNAVLQTVVNNTGVIEARGVARHGGVIELLGGSNGTTAVSGKLDASAASHAGGKVTVTGKHVV